MVSFLSNNYGETISANRSGLELTVSNSLHDKMNQIKMLSIMLDVIELQTNLSSIRMLHVGLYSVQVIVLVIIVLF